MCMLLCTCPTLAPSGTIGTNANTSMAMVAVTTTMVTIGIVMGMTTMMVTVRTRTP